MAPRSYRSPVRDAAAEKTRHRIVAAAAKLFGARGSPAFSLESVAKNARVTRLTVYNHFGSRRALLEAVFDAWAARGGLYRIPEAMSDPDPHMALRKLIAIFCAFWSFDREAMARLYGVGTSDVEFEESIRARNERRRRALSVLIGRMVVRGDVRAEAAGDLSDVLFVLTSFAAFAEIARGRSKDAACALIQRAAGAVIERGTIS
jgi:AcrR family transcriptional regulator